MNINSSIQNLRYNLPQNLERKVVEDIKEDIIETTQVQPIQESTVEEGYGRASRSQYLANMGIKIVSYNNQNPQPVEEPKEKTVVERQIEENTAQIETTRTANTANTANTNNTTNAANAAANTNNTTKTSGTNTTKVTPQTPVVTTAATVTTSSGSTIAADLYATTGELVEEITKLQAQNLSMPAEMLKGLNELGALAQDTEAYSKTLLEYSDSWMRANNVTEITETNCGQVMKDFFSDKFNINLANLAKFVGGAAIASLIVKVGVSTLVDVAPDICKDAFNWTKDTFKDILDLDVLEVLKDVVIDAPVMAIRNAGRVVGSLAENTYETAKDVVVAGAKGTYNTVSTAVSGTIKTVIQPINAVVNTASDVVSGVGNGLKNLVNGNVIGAVGSIVGGVAKGVGSVVSGVANTVGSAVSTVVSTASKAVKAVGDVAEAVFGNPIKAVGNAVKSVGKAIGKLFKGW